jgi:acetoin utilization deacetylase AcuC-like enzyme
MQVFFSPAQQRHAPKAFLLRGRLVESPERAERAEALLSAVRTEGHRLLEPQRFGSAPVAAVHDAGYLAFLDGAHAAWQALPGASAEITPNIHPNRHMSHRPSGIVGLAGWYLADTGTPIGPDTYQAALAAADTALAATQAVLAGDRVAYALCRPPGHHAYGDMAGGFCFLNNAAIAAEFARQRHPRVAVLDVDVHHGNGTQGIFYERADVLFVSLHGDPSGFYPFYAGYAEETGTGAGAGFTLNLPLPHGTGDAGYLEALAVALDRIRRYAPGVLVVSLGLDASGDDPLGVLKITTQGFRRIAQAVAALGLPTVLIQEGGYLSPVLGANLAAFLAGFEAAPI